MSRFRHLRGRQAGGYVVALLVFLAAACGSGATEGPDDDRPGRNDRDGTAEPDGTGRDGGAEPDGGGSGTGGQGNGAGGGDGRGGGEEYSWGLPGGDLSLDSVGDVFNQLRRGDCSEAESRLDAFIENEGPWPATRERLYRAAIAMCSGDRAAARSILGDGGVTSHPGDCRLYRAIWSVLDQRPQESVSCPEPEDDARPPDTGSTTSDTDGSTTATSDGSTTESTGPTTTGTGEGTSSSTAGGESQVTG